MSYSAIATILGAAALELSGRIGSLSSKKRFGLFHTSSGGVIFKPRNFKDMHSLRVEEKKKVTKLYMPYRVRSSSFQPGFFRNYENITHLYMGWCYNIYTLPTSLGELTKLKYLSAKESNLNSLPETIGNLENLVRLDLTDNNISTLPNTIGNLKNLKTLLLSGNNLKRIPRTIGNLSRLKELNISNNRIDKLPRSITNLKKLKSLDLRQNQLKELPVGIGTLKDLTFIGLGDNNWTMNFIDPIDFAEIINNSNTPLVLLRSIMKQMRLADEQTDISMLRRR